MVWCGAVVSMVQLERDGAIQILVLVVLFVTNKHRPSARAHIPSKHPKRAFTVASFSESFDAFGCTPVRQQSRGCKTMSACIDWCRHGTHVVRRPWHRKGTRAQSEGDKCALSRAPQGPPPFSIRYVLFRRLLFSGSWSVGVLYFGTSQCGNRSMQTCC